MNEVEHIQSKISSVARYVNTNLPKGKWNTNRVLKLVQRANERYMRGQYLHALRIINAAEVISQKPAYFPKKVTTISSLLVDLHKVTGWLFYPTILYKGACSFGSSCIEVGTPTLVILPPSDFYQFRGASRYYMNLSKLSTKPGTTQIVNWLISLIIGTYHDILYYAQTSRIRLPPERVVEVENTFSKLNLMFPNNACPRIKTGYDRQLHKLLNDQLVSFRADMQEQVRARAAASGTASTGTFYSRF